MNEKIVYSTGTSGPPATPVQDDTPPLKQTEPITLRLDRSGRKGKNVTLISGFRLHPQGKTDLLRKFQKICGAGGTVKEGALEIQGDHRRRLKEELVLLGYKVHVL